MLKKLLLIALVAFGLGAMMTSAAHAGRGTIVDPYRPPVNTPPGP